MLEPEESGAGSMHTAGGKTRSGFLSTASIALFVMAAFSALSCLIPYGPTLSFGLVGIVLAIGASCLYSAKRPIASKRFVALFALLLVIMAICPGCTTGGAVFPSDYSSVYGTYYAADAAQDNLTLSQTTDSYTSNVEEIAKGTYTYEDCTLDLSLDGGEQLSYHYVDAGDSSYFEADSDGQVGLYKSKDDARVVYEEQKAAEATVIPKPVATSTLKVHYIDVGQGDSEFIELPDGKCLLIDAGEADEGQTIISYIKALGYSRIDYVVATHPHADHIGGLAAVLKSFDIGEVWAPSVSTNTQTFEGFLDAVSAKGLQINTASSGKSIGDGSSYTVSVLSPAVGASYSDLNDYSAVLLLTFGNERFLFTGDASVNVLSGCNIGHVDVLKVAHHGSSTGTTTALVSALSPTYAIISCGAGNSYGHPHQEALDALAGTTLFRTDTQGTVVAMTDGLTISFNVTGTVPTVSSSTSRTSSSTSSDNSSSAGNSSSSVSSSSAAATVTPAASSSSGDDTVVYVTKTGKKYHRDGCKCLAKSKIQTTLSKAEAEGYTPCSVCDPPE